MVTTQPYFRQVGKLIVVGYLLRDQVAVIIDDWHFGCVFVIQFLSCLGLEQEIGIEKGFMIYRFLNYDLSSAHKS